MGGPFGHSRFFSRFISLQVKAELAGTPLVLYTRKPSNEGSIEGNGNLKESRL